MAIQQIRMGLLVGLGIRFFAHDPISCLETLFDRQQGSEGFSIVWSLFAFLLFLGI